MKIVLLTVILAMAQEMAVAKQSETPQPVIISCKGEQCKQLDDYNAAVKELTDLLDRMMELKESFISDPPGYARSLDRQELLKKHAAAAARLKVIFDQMLKTESK